MSVTFSISLSDCTLISRRYSLDNAFAADAQRDTVLNSNALSVCTPFRCEARCRYGTQFYNFVGLYNFVGTVLNLNTLSVCTPFRRVVLCWYSTQFYNIVGLYYFFGTILNSTALSVCTPFSAHETLSTTLSPACA